MEIISTAIDPKSVNRAIAYSCRLLGMREYSKQSIHQKIVARGHSRAEALEAIDYLLDNNWLSDKRFTESYIRSMSSRGQGLLKVLTGLGQNQVEQLIIEDSLKESNIDWQQVCDDACKKKITTFADLDSQQKQIKLQRFLSYRGFSIHQIQLSLKKYLNK